MASNPECETHSLLFKIERQIFSHQVEFDENFQKNEQPPDNKGGTSALSCMPTREQYHCSSSSIINILYRLFPILSWLPKYSWRKQIAGDIMSGCTVAIMHIPQGMGYALLGGVSPIVGIYMAFFPVLVYVLLGTSHHISLGTFAVTTLMTGKLVDQYAYHEYHDGNSTSTTTEASAIDNSTHLTNIEVATAVCLVVGLWQILMSILRLGVLGIILSDHLVSGFTTAAAIHVVVSQTRNLLGIKVPRYNGPFRLVRTVYAIFVALPTANPAEVVVSCVAITFLAVHNDWLKPCYSKKIKFPIPTELFVLVIGTLATYFGHLDTDYGIKTLEYIPTGFPVPRSPPWQLLPRIVFDTIAVAVVAYAISLSMAKIFARKRGYAISNNQELLAQGAANVVGSFFSCMPIAASLSRSMLQESVGGETQLASVVSCLLLLMILLWIGPFFESLPLSVLASVIVVSLKGMFMQFRDFTSTLRISPLDSIVWMVTFLSVVITDIDIGLAAGAIASITVLLYRGHRPYAAIFGRLPGTELHVDIQHFPIAVEIPGIKIFHWAGAIHFANGEAFRREVDKRMLPPVAVSSLSSATNSATVAAVGRQDPCTKYGALDPLGKVPLTSETIEASVIPPAAVEYLVVDCAALSFVDLAGSKILITLFTDLKKQDITLVLACCCELVIRQLERCQFFEKFPKTQVYPTIIDAVMSIQNPSVSPSDVLDNISDTP